MNPQPTCCLPWCGASFPAEPSHARKFAVGGKLVTFRYPAMIDAHDIIPKSRGGDRFDLGNQAFICHPCHMAHHAGTRDLAFMLDPDDCVTLYVHDEERQEWREVHLHDEFAESSIA